MTGKIIDVVKVAKRHKMLILGVVALVNALVLAVCVFMAPVYESSALVTALSFRPDPSRAGNPDTRQEQMANSLARIAQSEEVVRAAVKVVGPEVLYPQLVKEQKPQTTPSIFENIFDRTSVKEQIAKLQNVPLVSPMADAVATLISDSQWLRKERSGRDPSLADSAFVAASNALSVRVEVNTDLLRLTFRHSNPQIAAEFVNAWAQAFIKRNLRLEASPGVVEFLREQERHYDNEFGRTSNALSAFARQQNMYSVDEQRRLLLLQRKEVAAALALTKGAIADKTAQANEVSKQLAKMKLPGLASQISGYARNLNLREDSADPAPKFPASDPPLLLVKVYQDTVAALVKIDAELAGQRALEVQQKGQFDNVNSELATLASDETQYERLKNEVNLAKYNAELFAKRVAEQQVDAELNIRQFSRRIQMVQEATPPLQANFPRPQLFFPLGSVLGLFGGVSLALLRDTRRREPAPSVKAIDPKRERRERMARILAVESLSPGE